MLHRAYRIQSLQRLGLTGHMSSHYSLLDMEFTGLGVQA